MKQITLNWTWKLESPLHHGSGLSRPGKADALIQRDTHGNAYITGDAVKGALRMSAEQILAWAGSDQLNEYEDVTEPKHALLRCIFGGQAQAHFEPARIKKPEADEPSTTVAATASMTVAATAINRKTGCADNNTLRTIELLPKGAKLKSKCAVWVQDEEKPVAAFLVAALAATEWLGGRTAAGWGRVKPTDVTVMVDKDTLTAADLLDTSFNLDAEPTMAREALAIGRHVASTEKPEWYQLTITLSEPTCMGNKPAVANAVDTLDSIPATTLRGALAAAWMRMGKSQTEVFNWLGDESRWTSAFPVDKGGDTTVDKGGDITVPVPMSFMIPKNGEGLEIVHDTLTALPPDPEIQWRKASARWMKPDNGLKPYKVDRETTMHVARDYTTGSKREGALYSRAHLEEQKSFVAWVKLPESAIKAMFTENRTEDGKSESIEIFLGKRTSAGHGAAKLKLSRIKEGRPSFKKEPPDDDAVFVQLLSPAIIHGNKGLPLRSLDSAAWNRLLGNEINEIVERITAKTAWRDVAGWMSTWNHGRAAATSIEAGSVWRLVPKEGKLDELREKLTNLAEKGLGERLHEGFGWFAVDPKWLGTRHDIVSTEGLVRIWPDPDKNKQAEPWPGMPVDVATLENIVRQLPRPEKIASDAKKRVDLRGPLQELATRARETDVQPAALLLYADRMANREKPRQWEGLKLENDERKKKAARTFLEIDQVKQSIDLFRFALEALLIHVGKEKGE